MANNPGAYSYLVFQFPLVSLQYTYSPSLQTYNRLGAHPWPSLSPVITLVTQKDWAITLNPTNYTKKRNSPYRAMPPMVTVQLRRCAFGPTKKQKSFFFLFKAY